MTGNLILKISKRLKEIAELFSELIDEIERNDENYFLVARRCAELEVRCEEMKREVKELEYDKKFFENELRGNNSFST